MDGFDLDLETIEREVDIDGDRRVVLGVLDDATPAEEWVEEIEAGSVLVLNIEGDLNTLVADFAEDIDARGGSLVHFRGFLIVTPPDLGVDTDRL